jgi:hypothetical protein
MNMNNNNKNQQQQQRSSSALGKAFQNSLTQTLTAEDLTNKALLMHMLGRCADTGDDQLIRSWGKFVNNNK